MVKFDDGQTQSLIKKLTLYKSLALTAFLIAFCCGMIAAAATARIEQYAAMIISLLAVAGCAAACFIAFLIPYFLTGRKIDEGVSFTLVSAIYENEDMLKGDREIAFNAAYSGGNLTFSRANSTYEITFNLSGLNKAASVYSAFGTRLTEFLEGYYSVHSDEGYINVTVTDDIGGRTETLEIVKDGNTRVGRNNYFIKRGLIK